ncbi:KilA-N domain-containing protein [Shewanella oncorhynchi]|uniref:KilA-N domain-containing protein n=1 Tax=Shewanella oncorhynchi TaxID=2726434 RepID=A0AA50KGI2_9GAMM|nr:KilA-N domain-containing protein [Shewanella oncorhynchi]WMB74201.1 KilA-N domain-containing protein [Shewanella oncorhynchi]
MKTLTITFANKETTLNAVEINGVEFYNMNDIFNASSELKPSKRPSRWNNKLSKRYEDEGKMVVLTGENNRPPKMASGVEKPTLVKMAHGGAIKEEARHGTQEAVVAYSQWIQTDFAYAVNAAFSALIDGDVDTALAIAQSVAKVQREVAKKSYRAMTDAIQAVSDNKFAYSNFAKLAFRVATGYELKDIQGEKLKGEDNRDFLVRMGDIQSVSNLDKVQIQIQTLLSIGMTFTQIKEHLLPN